MMHFARLSLGQSKDEERALEGMHGGWRVAEGQRSPRSGMSIRVCKDKHVSLSRMELDLL